MKKIISIILSVSMLMSTFMIANVSVSANSGKKTLITFQDACDQYWDKKIGKIKTVEYMFYMPDDMKNEYNDYYDGIDPTSYAAGIYWWEGTAQPRDCKVIAKEWPGYAVTRKAEDCDNVYIAEVPADVSTIVWNNSVDGGTDNTQPWYTKAMQSDDAGTKGYDPGKDKYGFYPNGLDSMEGMIYVCNPDDTTIHPASQKVAFKGEWFYYYGNGEYGYAPTRKEAGNKVYRNGEFPEIPDTPIEENTAPTEDNTVPTTTEPKVEHSHKVEVVCKKSPTYFEEGYSGDEVCISCGEVISRGNRIAKLKLSKPKVTVKGSNKKLTVKYEKVSGATGFQVKYKEKKTTTKSYDTTKSKTVTISGIKKGNYTVYVRAFVKQGSKTEYSAWTNAKTVKVSASGTDITSKMKKNAKFKKLADLITWYALGDATGKRTTKTVKIKNTNANRLSIATYVRYHSSNDYEYSKKEMKTTVKNVFGKSITKYQSSGYCVKRGNKFYYGGGDWGNYQPEYEINEVTKKSGIYTVKSTGYIKAPTYEGTETRKICTVTITMKKKSSSSYGYIVTSMKYKGTGEGYF